MRLVILISTIILLSSHCFAQSTKDYRPVTTVYSDGTTMTLGGYGDPSQYSFSSSSSVSTTSVNGFSRPAIKQDKKTEKEERIEKIEKGNMYTFATCNECKNEGKSRKSYREFVELVKKKKLGEAMDLKQYNVNCNFTEENPDEMSVFRYLGLVVFCEQQCKLKYPESRMNYIHDERIRAAAMIADAFIDKAIANGQNNTAAFKIKAYRTANLFEQAKQIYIDNGRSELLIDSADIIAVELNSGNPDIELVKSYSKKIFDERLTKIKSYSNAQQNLRAIDESSLGSFLIEELYLLTHVNSSTKASILPTLMEIQTRLETNFTTEEGKERFNLINSFFQEIKEQG